MDPATLLDGGCVEISAETYAVLTTESAYPNAFATIQDGDERTVVVAENELDEADAIDVEPDWKRLTFDMDLPFDLVGFLATVSSILAEENVSIFAVSAYSTDHILVKRREVETAVQALEELGCAVERP